MRIDVQAHFMPTGWLKSMAGRTSTPRFEERDGKYFKVLRNGAAQPIHLRLYDVEHKIAVMDSAGIDMANISLSMFMLEQFEPDEAIALTREANDETVEICRRYPNRLIPIASLPLSVPDACVPELERCVNELGMKAVQIHANTGGVDPDAQQFWPIYERIAELDVPMILHPSYPFKMDERLKDYGLISQLGYMFDSCTAITRIIYSGLLDHLPTLKIISPHLANGLLWYIGRLDYGLQHVATTQRTGGPKMKHLPSYYLKQLYLDTVVNFPLGVMMAYQYLGADRMLFATDYPFCNPTDAVAQIESLPIPDEDKQKIFSENTIQLLKLDVAAPAAS